MTEPDTKPINCCGSAPSTFTDTKVGQTISQRVVNCATCGKYSDADTDKQAIWKWNNKFRDKNPVDKQFQAGLERGWKG